MKIIGLTGGIGSGKTTVAKLFESIGVPIFIADIEAKKLMQTSKVIKRKLITTFGESAYINNTLNRAFIAKEVFNNKDKLNQINAIVHPKVQSSFKRWCKQQDAAYVIYESAIIFELEKQHEFFKTILVTAKKDIKIKRLIKRDTTTKQAIESRMNNQWDDTLKIKLADYIINNNSLENTKKQVYSIDNQINSKIIF